MVESFRLTRGQFIRRLALGLTLALAHNAAAHGFAVINEVSARSEDWGSSVLVKMTGDPVYKVIEIQKKELLIALKDSEISQEFACEPSSDDTLIEAIEVGRSPNDVICLLVRLRKAYTGIDHEMDADKNALHIKIRGEPLGPVPAAVSDEPAKAVEQDVPDSPAVDPKSTGSEAPGMPEHVNRLLNPGAGDNTPDREAFLNAAADFQMGRWGETVHQLKQIIEKYPKSQYLERSHFLMAMSYNLMFEKDISGHLVEIKKYYQDAISKFPGSDFVAHAMVSIGNAYALAGNHFEALAYYNLVLGSYASTAAVPEALFERGKLLAMTKKSQEAVQSFEEIEKSYPGSRFAVAAKIERAKALFDMNSFKHALEALDEVIAKDPGKIYEVSDILLYSGYCHYELGDLGKARDALTRVLNYYPENESNHLILTRIADTYREEADGGKDERAGSKAARLYNLVVRRFPDSEGSLISMLRLAADIEKVEPGMLFPPLGIEEITYRKPAPDIYKVIISTHDESSLAPLAVLRLANRQHMGNDHDGSVKTLRDFLSEHPDTSFGEEIRSALGASVKVIMEKEYKAGNYGRIVGYYEQMQNDLSGGRIPDVLLMVGDSYRRLHLYDNAISMFNQAGESYAFHEIPAALLFGLGESYYGVQRLEDAQQVLTDFVARFPEDDRTPRAYLVVGEIMQRQKKYEKAKESFESALQGATDESQKLEILFAMADVLSAQEDYKEASRLLNEAIGLLGKNKAGSNVKTYDAYQRLGEVYMNIGDHGNASSAFERALEVSPKGGNDHSIRFRLAECYERLQDNDKAEIILNEIIASGDPFWNRMAQEKMNEININKDLQREMRQNAGRTSQILIRGEALYA